MSNVKVSSSLVTPFGIILKFIAKMISLGSDKYAENQTLILKLVTFSSYVY